MPRSSRSLIKPGWAESILQLSLYLWAMSSITSSMALGDGLGNSLASVMYNTSSLISAPNTPKLEDPNAGSP